MATNCPQQLKPRAWRSARCSTTACSNWRRENNCNIWLKMLDTRITAAVVLPTIYVFSTQTVADCYRRRSKPNLDKSDILHWLATFRLVSSKTLPHHLKGYHGRRGLRTRSLYLRKLQSLVAPLRLL